MRVEQRLDREQTASLLEQISGSAPKPGFKAITAASTANGGMVITWLNAEGEPPKKEEPKGADAVEPPNS